MVLALDEVGGGVCGVSLPPPSLEVQETYEVWAPHDALPPASSTGPVRRRPVREADFNGR